MKVVILGGGSGKRLWPYSRTDTPKQFLRFGDRHSLLQRSILRFVGYVAACDILIVTHELYASLVRSQLKEIGLDLQITLLIEPQKKNTAPALALAVAYFMEQGCSFQEYLLIAPSDHHIAPTEQFLATIPLAQEIAAQGKNAIFAVRPHKAETGFGYIKPDGEGNVQCFIEKPDYSTAQKYLLSNDYLWNCGIFLTQIATLHKEFQEHCPVIARILDKGFSETIACFHEMPDISIDYAVMEKSKRCAVVLLNASWSDVGSWDSVYALFDKDENCNVKIGNVHAVETKNCLILGNTRLISTLGLEDLLIIETPDALFLGKKGQSQRVKQLVEELEDKSVI